MCDALHSEIACAATSEPETIVCQVDCNVAFPRPITNDLPRFVLDNFACADVGPPFTGMGFVYLQNITMDALADCEHWLRGPLALETQTLAGCAQFSEIGEPTKTARFPGTCLDVQAILPSAWDPLVCTDTPSEECHQDRYSLPKTLKY